MSTHLKIGNKIVYNLDLTKARQPLSLTNQFGEYITPSLPQLPGIGVPNLSLYDNKDLKQIEEVLLYEYKDKTDIDKMLIIRDEPQIYNDKKRRQYNTNYPLMTTMYMATFDEAYMPDEINIKKNNDSSIIIILYNFDITKYNSIIEPIKSLFPLSTYSPQTGISIQIDQNNIYDISKLMNLVITPNLFNKHNSDRLKEVIYEFIFDTSNYKEYIFKKLITINYPKAIDFLNNNMELLPLFIDIVYFEYNDPRYFEVLHEIINNVIVDDQKLKLYSDENNKKIYYVLAQIIMSNPDVYNTNEGKLAVLEYLFKADNYLDSKQLRNRISYDIMKYELGETPVFEINTDTETILNLLNLIRQLKK